MKQLEIEENNNEINLENVDVEDLQTERKTKVLRKDPTNALGGFVSLLDVESIEKSIDLENLDITIQSILKENNNNFESLLSETLLYSICKLFKYRLREFIELLMEKYPNEVNMTFIKTKVKPFIMHLQKEKNEYIHYPRSEGKPYKPIFELL